MARAVQQVKQEDTYMVTQEKPLSPLYVAACAADDAYGAELRRLFGARAGDVRYTLKGSGKPGSELRRLRDTKLAADRALAEATQTARDGAP